MPSAPALLLVDDREDNLVALGAALEPLGLPVLTARSGEEALKRLLLDDVALIILDVQMPGLDGFQTAEAIKERERTRDIPILFLTAISREPEHRMRGYATGAVDYLFKPIDPEVLRAKAAVFVELYVKNRLLEDQREQLARKTAELEQSNADLEQFTYIASHDLQEPLRVMAGYLELIADTIGEALDDRARGWFDRTHDAAARMSDLLQNLLIYARAGAGAPERVPVPLGAALNAAIEHLSAAIQQAGADVRTPAELPSVPGSMRELTQVFQSVLSNALRYRSDRPLAVDVSARIDGDDVIVTVADNGRGVPPDQLERVFGLFEQVEGHPYPGSGLGLAICRKLVGRLGGRIWMEPNDGGGVRVHVLLPCGPG